MSNAMQNEQSAAHTRINGVDIETLADTVNAIKEDPGRLPLPRQQHLDQRQS